jgi:metal-sulfur cluster biosynthetic enzyme
VKVELTFDPPWTPQSMSADARMALGLDDVMPTRPYR